MPDYAADLYIQFDGMNYPLILARDENGKKQLGDGVAPLVAPQFRTTGYGYEHTPPEIEVIENFQHYAAGAGYERSEGNNLRYNFTRGIDFSWGMGIVALKRQAILESDGTAIAAAPTKFYASSLGLYMLAGAYIYEWDLGSTAWVLRDDATGTFSGAAYTDMIELDGVLYAARGTSADYKYSTDGVTFTAFTDADENATVFSQRGNGSDIAAIWKLNNNVIKVTTDGKNSGVAWAGADEMGHTSETTRALLTVDNDMYAFKKEGIYFYDGTNTQDIWKTQYLDDNNGKNAYLWSNKAMYAPYGRRLFEYDPNPNVVSNLRPVFPTKGMNSKELRGDITAIGGSETHLFIAVKTNAGGTYILKGVEGTNGWEWHTVHYLGANDCNALMFVGPGVMHATNPALVFGYGTAAHYVVYPRQGVDPWDDTNVTYETDEGSAYFPRVDFNAATYPKFLNRGSLLGYNLSAGRYATLKYETDYTGTETTLVEATAEGLNDNEEESEVSFHLVRGIIYMATGDTSITPRVEAWVFGATLNPPRKLTWNPVIILSENITFEEGVEMISTPSPDVMKRLLFSALAKRITLTDRTGFNGLTHIARLLDIQPSALSEKDQGDFGSDALVYQLTLVGINSLSSDAITAVYGQSSFGGGHVYG